MQSHEELATEMLRMLGGSPLPEAVQRVVLRRLILAEDKVVDLQRLLHDRESDRTRFHEQAAKIERVTSTSIRLEGEATRLRADLSTAEQVIAGLRETLEGTQAVLRRYMECVDLNACLCDQCDEEPPRVICCESCIYCQARYALGEVN